MAREKPLSADRIKDIADRSAQIAKLRTLGATVRECWSLSNLQPLWAVDNLKKGARYAGT